MKAQAVVAVSPGRVEYREVDCPDPGPQDVVVRLSHSWISNGTEGSYVKGERIGGDTAWREGDPLPFPHVPGYQKTGTVERVGAEVEGLAPGDRVFAAVSRISGMFFDYAGHVSPSVCHESHVWKLPNWADPEPFSGLVLTQVGLNVASRPSLQPGDRAVVIGDGLVGQWAAQTLQNRGAKVMLLGRRDDRLARFALREGDEAVNVRESDPLAAAAAWAPEGLQAICHTFGEIDSMTALLPLLRRFGHIVSAGYLGTEGWLDIQTLRDQELTLHAVAGWQTDRMNQTLREVASGRLTTSHLITHRFSADQAGQAFDLILSRAPGVLGVVLTWPQ